MEISILGRDLHCHTREVPPYELRTTRLSEARSRRNKVKLILLAMQLTGFLLIAACLHVSAHGYSQKVSFSGKSVPLNAVFASIEKQTGFSFFFNYALIKDTKPVTLEVRDVPLEEALNQVLGEVGLDFYKTGKTIFIVKKPVSLLGVAPTLSAPPLLTIKGRVVNHLGESLPSATIIVRNGKKSVLTNEKGEFELKGVDPGALLEVSYLGYEKKQVAASSEFIVVQLILASNQLDEAQVIAYGQTTQRMSTSNITMVRGKDIEAQPVNNPLQALEGRVPGLFISQYNGLPGGGISVRIQGQNSMHSGNSPLFVVDGVPFISSTLSTTSLGPLGASNNEPFAGVGNPLTYINTADIESVEVLKDADATSIYGSRAANGAILITTKKGRVGKSKVSFNLQNGWGAVKRRLPLMNTQQYLDMRHEAQRNDNIATPGFYDYDINGFWDSTRYTDWQKILLGGTAQYTNLTGAISGGSTNIQYTIGGTYHRETAVFPGKFNDVKGSVHFSLNTISANQKLRVQLTGSYLVDDNKLPTVDPSSAALTLPPDAPTLFKPDGTLNWQLDSNGGYSWQNPLTFLYYKYQSKGYNLTSNSHLQYTILPGLEIRTNLGYNSTRINEFVGRSLLALTPSDQKSLGTKGRTSAFSYSTINSWIVEPQLHYDLLLGEGRLEALVGSTINQVNSDGFQISGTGYNSDAQLSDIHSAASVFIPASAQRIYKYNALFSRVNYTFREKYVINFTARRDGSSRFGPASEFHNFFSIGGGWAFSQENFIAKRLKFLSFGKIRGSYGTTGNDQIGDYQFMNLYNPQGAGVPYQSISTLVAGGLPNPYLQWEETRKLQFGIDLGLLKDRILLTADFVRNISSNQLISFVLPIITGFRSITINQPAKIENKELELVLKTLNVQDKHFTWSTSINFTLPQNKLVAYAGTVPSNLSIGKPLSTIKVFQFMGVDPSTGQYQFLDSHGSLTTTPDPLADNIKLVDVGRPRYYGGFQNTVRFRQFQLDFLFQYVKIIEPNYRFGAYLPGEFGNQPTYLLNRWQKAGDITTTQAYNSNDNLASSYFNVMSSDGAYSDASFIRLKNLTFSYEAPASMIHHMHIQTMRIYLQGQNLLTLTNFQGMDPESGPIGVPLLRILTAGLQMEF